MSEPIHPVAICVICIVAFFMAVAVLGDCLR